MSFCFIESSFFPNPTFVGLIKPISLNLTTPVFNVALESKTCGLDFPGSVHFFLKISKISFNCFSNP
jgi:hypothetical protein